VPRGRLAAATAGDHALFAGGRNDAPFGSWVVYDTVDIYDDTTGSWSTTALTQARAQIGVTSTGARAYFAGGDSASGLSLVYDTVDVYEPATGMGTPLALSVPRMGVAASAVGNTVLFAGGYQMLGGGVTVVDVLDDATGAWGPTASLSADKGGMAATAVGDQALFASGIGSAGATDLVEVYASPWTDLGGGTLGVAGQPTLTGFGSLEGGTTASVFLADVPPSAAMLAWISFAPVPFSALGGTVHAFPFTNQLGLVSSGAGSFGAGTTWPAGLPTGTQVWFQFIVADVSSIHGLSLSNGLRATSP
jgi:hypothetical protein